MNVNELRIGNCFREKFSGDLIQVIGLTETGITFDNEYIMSKWQVEPIEIEAIFYTQKESEEFINLNEEVKVNNKEKVLLIYNEYHQDCITYRLPRYVHELQNLVFELKRIKLELKLFK